MPDILVVGAGFSGFWAATAAKRVAGQRLSVALLAPEPRLVMRPRLYERDPEALSIDLLPLFSQIDVQFIKGEASGLDVSKKSVLLNGQQPLQFSRLIVATGSRMARPRIPGAQEAFSIDTQVEAIRFDRHLREICTCGHPLTIAVVGAGFTGLELALEMRDRITAHGGRNAGEMARLLLVDRAAVVGSELGDGPKQAILDAVGNAGIELRLSAEVRELGSRMLRLQQETIDADAVVLTTGQVAAPYTAAVPGVRDDFGRIVVDQYLRAPDAPGIFVTGDAAAADVGDGHRTLQSCQHALRLGRFAGENAARDALGMSLIPYEQRRYVTCLDLGRAGAVYTEGWERKIRMIGEEAKSLKKRINTSVIYPPFGGRDELLAASAL